LSRIHFGFRFIVNPDLDPMIEYALIDCIDGQELQLDLDNVCKWASRWQMKFNMTKCKVMHYANGNMGYNYSMEGVPVEEVDCEKDLGVTFTTDLNQQRPARMYTQKPAVCWVYSAGQYK